MATKVSALVSWMLMIHSCAASVAMPWRPVRAPFRYFAIDSGEYCVLENTEFEDFWQYRVFADRSCSLLLVSIILVPPFKLSTAAPKAVKEERCVNGLDCVLRVWQDITGKT